VENRILSRTGDARITTGLTELLSSVLRLGGGDGVHNLWTDLWTVMGARGEIL
jgi:hypothetical protein